MILFKTFSDSYNNLGAITEAFLDAQIAYSVTFLLVVSAKPN